MPSVWSALLQSWGWRIDLIIVLALAGTIYTWGWFRLRARSQTPSRLANGWRLAAYLGGLVVLAIALMSPIDVLGQQLFTFHMVQHLLTIMIAAPLLLLANPFPFFLWGLPWKGSSAGGRVIQTAGSIPKWVAGHHPPHVCLAGLYHCLHWLA